MSLILDALRKMEQDRKSRQAAQEMRSQVLRYRAPVAPQQAKPYAMLVVGVLLVSGGVGAGFLLKGNRQPPQSQKVAEPTVAAAQSTPGPGAFSPPAAVAPSAISVPVPAATPSAVPAPVTPAAPTPASPTSSRGKGKAQPAPVLANAATADAAPLRSVEAPSSRPSRRAAGKNRVAAALPAQATALTEVMQGAPDIAVSGIAWQDERNLRRAVLNGTLVGEGAQVAGARVVEIRENRVRLSRGGQVFEIPLTSGFGR